MKSWARTLALALSLSAAVPATAVMAAENVEQVLLDKANYWRLKDRPDLAIEALDKLLAMNPNQPEALFQYGMIQLQQGKTVEAQRTLARLREAAPNSTRVADLESSIRAGKVGGNELNEARRLAQSGQMDEAVQKYQQTFRGSAPPSSYGPEYYMTLAGTANGWDEARRGLQQLAQQSPNDTQVQLSLAQVLTYREQTRADGIARLAQLAKDPVVGASASRSWRQALTWLGGSAADQRLYQQYLAQRPDDTEIQQHMAAMQQRDGAGGTPAQTQGYADLQRGNVAAAERQFAADMKARPDDADALAGLGLVRLRQQRFGEARDLLARAMRASPARQKDLAAAHDSAVFWSQVNEAKALSAHGNNARAKAMLQHALSRPRSDDWGAWMVLADVDRKLNDNAGAEQAYRHVLRSHPGNRDAMVGLARALNTQGKTAEVEAMTSRLSPADKARLSTSGAGTKSPAQALRDEAQQEAAQGNNAGAMAKYRAAMAADPKDPWIRFDFANFLAGQGNTAEGFRVVDPAQTGNTPASVLAAATFDTKQGRWAEAFEKADRVPSPQRSQALSSFRDRIMVRGTVERAKQLYAAGNREEARRRLVAVYSDASASIDDRRMAAYTLYDLGEKQAALDMTRAASAKPGVEGAKAAVDYARLLLLSGGNEEAAAAALGQAEAGGALSGEALDDLQATKAILATRQADKLREAGNYSQAEAVLAPSLAARPDDPTVLMAAGRLAASRGRDSQAMEYFDKAYQQDASNIDIIRGVVFGAIQARELSKAEEYLAKGMEQNPDNAWLYFLKAQVARARGNYGEAMEALQRARALNQQKGGVGSTASPADLVPASRS